MEEPSLHLLSLFTTSLVHILTFYWPSSALSAVRMKPQIASGFHFHVPTLHISHGKFTWTSTFIYPTGMPVWKIYHISRWLQLIWGESQQSGVNEMSTSMWHAMKMNGILYGRRDGERVKVSAALLTVMFMRHDFSKISTWLAMLFHSKYMGGSSKSKIHPIFSKITFI